MATALDRETFFHERRYEDVLWQTQHIDYLRHDSLNPLPSLEHIVAAIDEATPDSVVIIRGSLTPSQYYSPVNHLKRGTVVQLPRYQQEAIGPTRLRQQTFQQLPLDFYVGYRFMSPNNQRANRVLLTFCIEAARRFVWSRRSTDPADHITLEGKKLYHSKAESPEIGWTADVRVPSHSDVEKRYIIKVKGIPVNRKTQHAVWRHLETEGHTGGEQIGHRHSGCELKYYGELTMRRPQMTLWCPHEIMAHMAITRHVFHQRGYILLQPFALPSKRAVVFDKKLRNNVFVQEIKKDKQGRSRLSHRHLHLDEKEVLHWGHVIAHRDENVFYATNMHAYDVW